MNSTIKPVRHSLRKTLSRLLKTLSRLRMRAFKQLRAASLRSHLRRHGNVSLHDFYDASREVGISPFLMWGTLLGWVREGRFLRHDTDVDLGILTSDYAKKDILIAAMQKRGYRMLVDKAYKLRFARPPCRLWIDVDVFYPWNGKMICSADKTDGTLLGAFFSPDAFQRLREIDFADDIKVLIPDPPEPVLEAIYGDWRTPLRHYRGRRDLLNRLLIPPGQPKPSL